MKNILIALDSSDFMIRVAQSGVDLAQNLQARIFFVHVVDDRLIMTDGAYTPQELIAALKKDAEMLLTKITSMFGSLPARAILEEGNPGERILKQAKEVRADTIVLGTHGRTGLSRLVMGSVAEHVLRHSECPVLVIPFKTLKQNKS